MADDVLALSARFIGDVRSLLQAQQQGSQGFQTMANDAKRVSEQVRVAASAIDDVARKTADGTKNLGQATSQLRQYAQELQALAQAQSQLAQQQAVAAEQALDREKRASENRRQLRAQELKDVESHHRLLKAGLTIGALGAGGMAYQNNPNAGADLQRVVGQARTQIMGQMAKALGGAGMMAGAAGGVGTAAHALGEWAKNLAGGVNFTGAVEGVKKVWSDDLTHAADMAAGVGAQAKDKLSRLRLSLTAGLTGPGMQDIASAGGKVGRNLLGDNALGQSSTNLAKAVNDQLKSISGTTQAALGGELSKVEQMLASRITGLVAGGAGVAGIAGLAAATQPFFAMLNNNRDNLELLWKVAGKPVTQQYVASKVTGSLRSDSDKSGEEIGNLTKARNALADEAGKAAGKTTIWLGEHAAAASKAALAHTQLGQAMGLTNHAADESRSHINAFTLALGLVGFKAFVDTGQRAVAFLSSYWNDAVKGAAQEVQGLDLILTKLGSQAGSTPQNLRDQVQSLKEMGGAFTTADAQNALISLVKQGIDTDATTKVAGSATTTAVALAGVAKNASAIAGSSPGEALQQIEFGVQTGQSRTLRAAGLNVNFVEAYAKYAAELHKDASALTEAEKQQARVNDVVRAGIGIQGAYDESLSNAAQQQNVLKRVMYDVTQQVGQYGTPVFKALVDMQSQWVHSIEAATAKGTGFSQMMSSLGRDIGQWMTQVNEKVTSALGSIRLDDVVGRIRATLTKAFDYRQIAAMAAGAGVGLAGTMLSGSKIGQLVGLASPLEAWQGAILGVIASNKQLREAAWTLVKDLASAASGVGAFFGAIIGQVQHFIDANASVIAKLITNVGDAIATIGKFAGSMAPLASGVAWAVLGFITQLTRLMADIANHKEAVTVIVALVAAFKVRDLISDVGMLNKAWQLFFGNFGNGASMMTGFVGRTIATLGDHMSGAVKTTTAAATGAASAANAGMGAPPASVGGVSATKLGASSMAATAAAATAAAEVGAAVEAETVKSTVTAKERLKGFARQSIANIGQKIGDSPLAAGATSAVGNAIAGTSGSTLSKIGHGAQSGLAGAVTGGAIGMGVGGTGGILAGAAGGAMAGMAGGPWGAAIGAGAGALAAVVTSGLKSTAAEAAKVRESYQAMWKAAAENGGAVAAMNQVVVKLHEVQTAQENMGGKNAGGAYGRYKELVKNVLPFMPEDADVTARRMSTEVNAAQDAMGSLAIDTGKKFVEAYDQADASLAQMEKDAKQTTEVLATLLSQDPKNLAASTNLTTLQMQRLEQVTTQVSEAIDGMRASAVNLGGAMSATINYQMQAHPNSSQSYFYQMLQQEQNSAKDLQTFYARKAAEVGQQRQVMNALAKGGADYQMLDEFLSATPDQVAAMWDQISKAQATGGQQAVTTLVQGIKAQRDAVTSGFESYRKDAGTGIANAQGSLKLNTTAEIVSATKQANEYQQTAQSLLQKRSDLTSNLDAIMNQGGSALTGVLAKGVTPDRAEAVYANWKQLSDNYDKVLADTASTAEQRDAAAKKLATASEQTKGLFKDSGLAKAIEDAGKNTDLAAKNNALAAGVQKQIDDSTKGNMVAGVEASKPAIAEAGKSSADTLMDATISQLNVRAPDVKAAIETALSGKTAPKPSAAQQDATRQGPVAAAILTEGKPASQKEMNDAVNAQQKAYGKLEEAKTNAIQSAMGRGWQSNVKFGEMQSRVGDQSNVLKDAASHRALLQYTSVGIAKNIAEPASQLAGRMEAARQQVSVEQSIVDAIDKRISQAKPGSGEMDRLTKDRGVAGTALTAAQTELKNAQSDFVKLGKDAGLVSYSFNDVESAAKALASALSSGVLAKSQAPTGQSANSQDFSSLLEDPEVKALQQKKDAILAAQKDYQTGMATAEATFQSQQAMARQQYDEKAGAEAERLRLQVRDAEHQFIYQVEDAYRQHYRQLEDMARQHSNDILEIDYQKNLSQRRFIEDQTNWQKTNQAELVTQGLGFGGQYRAAGQFTTRTATAGAYANAASMLRTAMQPGQSAEFAGTQRTQAISGITAALLDEAKAMAQAHVIGKDYASLITYMQQRFVQLGNVIPDLVNGFGDLTKMGASLDDALSSVNDQLDKTIGLQMNLFSSTGNRNTAYFNLVEAMKEHTAMKDAVNLLPSQRAEAENRPVQALNSYVKALQDEANAKVKTGSMGVGDVRGFIEQELTKLSNDMPDLQPMIANYLSSIAVNGASGGGTGGPVVNQTVADLQKQISDLKPDTELAIKINIDENWNKLLLEQFRSVEDADHSFQRQVDITAIQFGVDMNRMAEDHGIAIGRMYGDSAFNMAEAGRILGINLATAAANYNIAAAGFETSYHNALTGIGIDASEVQKALQGITGLIDDAVVKSGIVSGNMLAVIHYLATNGVPDVATNNYRSAGVGGGAVTVRDSGGFLNKGLNMIWNGTGRNEPILNPSQWDAIITGMKAMSVAAPSIMALPTSYNQTPAGSEFAAPSQGGAGSTMDMREVVNLLGQIAENTASGSGGGNNFINVNNSGASDDDVRSGLWNLSRRLPPSPS